MTSYEIEMDGSVSLCPEVGGQAWCDLGGLSTGQHTARLRALVGEIRGDWSEDFVFYVHKEKVTKKIGLDPVVIQETVTLSYTADVSGREDSLTMEAQ